MDRESLLDRLISQLDTLIPFLEISRRNVFRLLRARGYVWFYPAQRNTFPKTYQVYQKQVCHSALLLGFSYFEAFLADLVRQIYLCNPKMLPSEKQLKFEEILAARTYEGVLNGMIEKEVMAVFYKSMEDVCEYFRSKLKLELRKGERDCVVVASLLRNCIVHNNGRADSRLARRVTDYREGDEIFLDEAAAHEYGISIRSLARDLYGQATKRYFRAKPIGKSKQRAPRKAGRRRSPT
ncbi:MAG: hypothetical protein WCD04_03935 [Terriglobia bacterium]|jgi:hypothetical protein